MPDDDVAGDGVLQEMDGYVDARELVSGHFYRWCPDCGETWWEHSHNRCPACDHEASFRRLAPKYAEKWVRYSAPDGEEPAGAWYWPTIEAMATELRRELNYDVNPLTCKGYILEALPEDHPDHETIEEREARLYAD